MTQEINEVTRVKRRIGITSKYGILNGRELVEYACNEYEKLRMKAVPEEVFKIVLADAIVIFRKKTDDPKYKEACNRLAEFSEGNDVYGST